MARFAGHGHNGYLDLLITIGLPGLLLSVLALLVWPFFRLLLSLQISKPQRSLLLAALAFCAGHNLTESSIMNGSSVVQVFLVLVLAMIHQLSNASEGSHKLLRRRVIASFRIRTADMRHAAAPNHLDWDGQTGQIAADPATAV